MSAADYDDTNMTEEEFDQLLKHAVPARRVPVVVDWDAPRPVKTGSSNQTIRRSFDMKG